MSRSWSTTPRTGFTSSAISLTSETKELNALPFVVSGDIFSSVFGLFVSSSNGNLTDFNVIERLVGNVNTTTQNAFFVTPKIKVMQSGYGGILLTLRLVPQLRARYAMIGQRIASLGAGELDVKMLNQTDLSIFMKASGSQYLTSTSTAVIPLRNLLDGTLDIVGSQAMAIQVILTATTVTALETSKSIASISGPLSVIATTPASAMAVTRLSILVDILQCGLGDDDDSGNNFLRISIGPAAGSSLRGAVVGNLAIVALFAVLFGLMFVAVIVHGHCVHSAPPAAMLQDLLDVFHFPGIVMLPIVAVAQPTLTAAVQLIALTPVKGDILFGVLGAAVVLLLMMTYTIVITTQFCLTLTEAGEGPKEIVKADSRTLTPVTSVAEVQPPSMLRRVLHGLFGERKTWQPLDPTRVDQVAWKKRFAPIFLDCSTWWYPLADMWMSAFVGVAGGLTLGNQSICFFQLAVVTSSYAFIATLQMIVAPPLVFASRCYVMALQVLGLISCGAVLAAVVTDENNASSLSVSIASMCMLIIAAITTVKSCLDIVFILLAIPGRLRRAAGIGALHRRHARTEDPGESVVVDVALHSRTTPRLLLRGESSLSQVSIGSFELHDCGIESVPVAVVSPSHSETSSLDAIIRPALELNMAESARAHELHHHDDQQNCKENLGNAYRLLGAIESSRTSAATRGESLSLSKRSFLQREDHSLTRKPSIMRRSVSSRAVRSVTAKVELDNREQEPSRPAALTSPPLRRGAASVKNLRPGPVESESAAAGLDSDDVDWMQQFPLDRKTSSMRGLLSRSTHEEGEPLRRGVSSFRDGVMDERDRSHLARRAAMMLRVDAAPPARVSGGDTNVDAGELLQHYHAIERNSSFPSVTRKPGNE
jgi:hypothetical protein